MQLTTFLKRLGKGILYIFLVFNVILAIQAYRTSYFYELGEYPPKKASERTFSEKLFGAKVSKRPLSNTPMYAYDTIRLKDGAGFQLEAWYVRAPNAKGTIILLHGHNSNKSGVVSEADYFYTLGYNTFLLDVRSHGNSQGNVCTVGYTESDNIKVAADWVAAQGEKNMIFWGTSMGASLILKGIADYHLKPQKVILNAPFGSMHEAVQGFLRHMHMPQTPLSQLMLFWGGLERGYWGFGFKPSDCAKSLEMPVLLQWGRLDDRVTEAETKRIFNNIASKQKKWVLYEKSGHQPFIHSEMELCKETLKAFLAE